MTNPSKIHLIFDFDGTLTHNDTLQHLALIGYRHDQQKQSSSQEEEDEQQQEEQKQPQLPSFSNIVQEYILDCDRHGQSYTPEKSKRKTISEESRWLSSLLPIELASVRRVEETGLFRGLTSKMVEQGAKAAVEEGRVRFRRGWSDAFELESSSLRLAIISINWSITFIRSCLLTGAEQARSENSRTGVFQTIANIRIHSNEIQKLDSAKGSTGNMFFESDAGIRTSADKLQSLKQEVDQDEVVGSFVIYVGDSATDFDCLVVASIGICIRDKPLTDGQKELAETLERVGIKVHPLEEFQASDDEGQGNVVYWTSSVESIAKFVYGTPWLEG